MKHIASRDNPEFKRLLKLAQNARESRGQQRTLLDGPHLVATYLEQLGTPELLVVAESRLQNSEIDALIRKSVGADTVVLKDSLFRALSGVDSPVGIAAVIPVVAATEEYTQANCVLLDRVQDAGNVGSILRTSAAAGFRDIFLSEGCAGAWSPRVMRAAQGAHFRLQIRESANLERVLENFQGTSIASVVSGGTSPNAPRPGRNCAWVFGNEGAGINAGLLALCTAKVTIPMASVVESLNVAAAAAICLFAQGKPIQ